MANTERFNVVFPADVLKDLRELVPPRKRGEFVVEATTKELKRLKVQALLERLRREPAWTLENHPDLATPDDVEHWVESLRASWSHPDARSESTDA